MKFIIDDNEIKTVIKGATVRGCLSLVSRSASFSFIYNEADPDFEKYKAKIGSGVKIKNDDNKNVFSGFITKINYNQDKKLVEIEASDYFSILLNKNVTGRFTGSITAGLNDLLSGFNIFFDMKTSLTKKLNVISFGNLSYYDILEIFMKNIYETEEFKLYIKSDSSIGVLLPLKDNSKGDFILGKNVISAQFSQDGFENIAKITAIGNENVVSGTVIKIIDPKNNKIGYFTVKNDIHTYGNIYTMELDLKERI